MASEDKRLVAVICENDARLAAAMVHNVGDIYGLGIGAVVTSGRAVLSAAEALQPDLVVVQLAVCGTLGLRVIGELHRVAPACAVVVVTPPEFGGLRLDAVAAGALSLVVASDLRPLQCSVERLMKLHGEEDCPSCVFRARKIYWQTAQ
ncbi:MAG: hypothetical protein WD794_16035 [Mycobacteriales bacterium]